MDVYLPNGHCWAQSSQTKIWGCDCLLLWEWVPVPHCFCLPQEPQPQHPTWHLQVSASARPEHQGALWSTILQIYSHPLNSSGGEIRISGHERNSGTRGKLVPPGNCSASFFFPWEFLTWSSSSLEGFFHQACRKGNEEAAVSCLCYSMTAIPGIIMALYIFQAFLWVSSFYQNTMQRPCQRPPSEYRFCCVIISSVTQLCPTLCNPMDCSTPGFPVYHQLLELTQSHVHWVSDAIQPSCPLSSPSPAAFNLSQDQGLFQWVSSSHQVAEVLGFQLQHQSFQWIFRTDFL